VAERIAADRAGWCMCARHCCALASR
jgi:hypothetical protein